MYVNLLNHNCAFLIHSPIPDVSSCESSQMNSLSGYFSMQIHQALQNTISVL